MTDRTYTDAEAFDLRMAHEPIVLPVMRWDKRGRDIGSPAICGRCGEAWPCTAIRDLEASERPQPQRDADKETST